MTSNPFVVVKFGGTSVASADCWLRIKEIVTQRLDEHLRPVVVCSAPTGVSNKLERLLVTATHKNYQDDLVAIKKIYEQLADQLSLTFSDYLTQDFEALAKLIEGISLLGEASPRVCAEVMSFGELMLTRLGAAYLQQQGVAVVWQDARELLVAKAEAHHNNNSQYLSVRCDEESDDALAKLSQSSPSVVITQGFIARNDEGETVLLGRGGSDTSAAYLAALIKAKRCEIWTDVPGIYTANPHQIPEARYIKCLDYDEAQEIAAMGGKILHPNSIPPLRRQQVPLHVRYTKQPERPGTVVSLLGDQVGVQIKSILTRHKVTLVTIETVRMWQQVGFLADVFACFKKHGISIDLVSTSEASVTVSLDPSVNDRDSKHIKALLQDLNSFARASLIVNCAAVSLVGHNIRGILHKLGGVFEVFEQQKVHMLSQAANDLNLTFVVDEDQADRLAQRLHTLLIEQTAASHYFNESWQQEFGEKLRPEQPWWHQHRQELLTLAAEIAPAYVYDQTTLAGSAEALQACDALDQIFYAVKANNHPTVLQVFYNKGLGFECVSLAEINHILTLFPDIDHKRILFTPNFAPRDEYEQGLALGVNVTIDGLYPMKNWPDVFAGQDIFVRVDPGQGYGHHKFVVTGGGESKFGVPLAQLSQLKQWADDNKTKIVGLHIHSGSGILTADAWNKNAKTLTSLLDEFSDVRCIDLGGGLGIVEKPGQKPLDLSALNSELRLIKDEHPGLSLWMEPGRFLVANAGVLLARVTQVKQKGTMTFVGIDTGMNSLIRPALYGAYHEIVNLTRLDQGSTQVVNIVGPICESGDTLGYARFLPETEEGDVILIATAGAYGRVMSSNYNLREPASEVFVATQSLPQTLRP